MAVNPITNKQVVSKETVNRSEQVSSNKQFEIDADSVFDFSESNPFGENP